MNTGRRLIRAIAVLAIASLFSATIVEAEQAISPGDVEGPFTWGSVDNVTRFDRLWFAGQPDRAGFEAAKAAGIEIVVNLRDPSEGSFGEPAWAEELGMLYFNVPVNGKAFDEAAFEQIESIVRGNEKAQILVHCSSSNRAGAWFATHLVKRHGLSKEDALAIGRKTGITNEVVETSVSDYLGSSAK